tara:strand:- start:962 stop:1330 length:369 start_codon:yes stop_codon:yes gene_type:complete
MINDIITNSLKNFKLKNIKNIDEVFNNNKFLISMSDNMKNDSLIIKDYLNKNVYSHKKLKKKREEVENIITKLFNYFDKNFHLLPKDWLILEKKDSKHRIICDYISGMTDRYASRLYKSLYE